MIISITVLDDWWYLHNIKIISDHFFHMTDGTWSTSANNRLAEVNRQLIKYLEKFFLALECLFFQIHQAGEWHVDRAWDVARFDICAHKELKNKNILSFTFELRH